MRVFCRRFSKTMIIFLVLVLIYFLFLILESKHSRRPRLTSDNHYHLQDHIFLRRLNSGLRNVFLLLSLSPKTASEEGINCTCASACFSFYHTLLTLNLRYSLLPSPTSNVCKYSLLSVKKIMEA